MELMGLAKDYLTPQGVSVEENTFAKNLLSEDFTPMTQIKIVTNATGQLVGVLTLQDFIRSRQIREMKDFLELLLLGMEGGTSDLKPLVDLEAYESAFNALTVKEIMSKPYLVVQPELPIQDVLQQMVSSQSHYAIVCDKNAIPLGFIDTLQVVAKELKKAS
jgi:CBS domain containing-hemolysin-like protein